MDLLKTLEILVEFDTVNDPSIGKYPDPGVVDFVEGLLNGLGIRTKTFISNGYRSIIGVVGNGSEPRVLMMAHLDVVPFVRDEWRFNPLRLTIAGDVAYGRGALDDKGNVAAVLKALEGLVGEVNRGTLIVAFTTDEEVGGENGARVVRDYLLNNGLRPNYVINADGYGMVIINRRRAIFNAAIRTKGLKATVNGVREVVRFKLDYKVRPPYHAAYFTPGVDTHPLLALSQYLWVNNAYLASIRGSFVKENVTPTWIEAEVVKPCRGCPMQDVDLGLTNAVKALLPLSRVNPKVKAQSIYGVTATPNVYRFADGFHEFVINVRAMTDDPLAIREAMMESVQDYLQDIEVDVRAEGGVGYLNTPRDSKLVTTAMEVLRKLGVEPIVMEMAGASDSKYFSPLGIEAIDFGPIGENAHGPNENVNIKSLEQTSKFYEDLTKELLNG
jgi:Acetylornithine deacetylase/Succinyl-diaminopimelate desuccinylase and related deacylases